MIHRLLKDQKGQDIMEYGLLAAFISIAAVGVLQAIGPLITPLYQRVVDALP